MEIETIPKGKNHNENFKKASEIIERRNEAIAKLFGVEKKQPRVFFCESTGYISKKIGSLEKEFKGYVDMSDDLYIIHPDEGGGFFSDLWPEMEMLSDYVLVQYYLCKIYFPEEKDFKLYYKYVSDQLAAVVSGKYKPEVARFEFKFYNKNKKIKKETLLGIMLYIMREESGVEFIFNHLDKIMEDKDIEKSIQDIYNKSIEELIMPKKKETIEEEKKRFEQEKARRQAAFNANQKNYSTNNAKKSPQYSQRKYVTRDKFKAKENNNNNNQKNSNNFNKKPNNKPKTNFNKNKNNEEKKEFNKN